MTFFSPNLPVRWILRQSQDLSHENCMLIAWLFHKKVVRRIVRFSKDLNRTMDCRLYVYYLWQMCFVFYKHVFVAICDPSQSMSKKSLNWSSNILKWGWSPSRRRWQTYRIKLSCKCHVNFTTFPWKHPVSYKEFRGIQCRTCLLLFHGSRDHVKIRL